MLSAVFVFHLISHLFFSFLFFSFLILLLFFVFRLLMFSFWNFDFPSCWLLQGLSSQPKWRTNMRLHASRHGWQRHLAVATELRRVTSCLIYIIDSWSTSYQTYLVGVLEWLSPRHLSNVCMVITIDITGICIENQYWNKNFVGVSLAST